MPEGHALHRIADDHTKWFAGETLDIESPQGRFAKEAAILSGSRLVAAEAFGKHLFYHWSVARKQALTTMHVHLGLYGKFHTKRVPLAEPKGAVRVRVVGSNRGFDLNGPNCCELINKPKFNAICARLGPDPLRRDADPLVAWNRIHRSRAAIGTLLLNQSVIAGIGNIFRAEILFQLGIHPDRLGKEMSQEDFERLWSLTVKLMTIGKQHNRIITAKSEETGKERSRLRDNERLLIYKKPYCSRCAAEVTFWDQGARTIYACERCQT
ncbi:Endonuclease 8 1 [Planctomycetes bacterium CA13]|uniref:DNA-(apurinic or apyrimidinic site) lyase n=2 Tax=Novipirellula herctigrandis TaxID=2527986 RepID=A0A5C5Z9H1_9BACT|nr:Endonuclease 8 1 [Planctomycetes bacterium CA13]